MKLFIIIAIVAVAASAMKIENENEALSNLMSSFQQLVAQSQTKDISLPRNATQVFGVKTAHKCSSMVDKLNRDAKEIAALVMSRNWAAVMATAGSFSSQLHDTAECYKGLESENVGNDWFNCVCNHLCKARSHLCAAVQHALKGQWQAANDELNIVWKILKDIQNC